MVLKSRMQSSFKCSYFRILFDATCSFYNRTDLVNFILNQLFLISRIFIVGSIKIIIADFIFNIFPKQVKALLGIGRLGSLVQFLESGAKNLKCFYQGKTGRSQELSDNKRNQSAICGWYGIQDILFEECVYLHIQGDFILRQFEIYGSAFSFSEVHIFTDILTKCPI